MKVILDRNLREVCAGKKTHTCMVLIHMVHRGKRQSGNSLNQFEFREKKLSVYSFSGYQYKLYDQRKTCKKGKPTFILQDFTDIICT